MSTLNRKFFLWSGPASSTNSNNGAPNFRREQYSLRRETGCLPVLQKQVVSINSKKLQKNLANLWEERVKNCQKVEISRKHIYYHEKHDQTQVYRQKILICMC